MTFNLGTRNLRTQPGILGPCGNDRIFNANSINPIFYYILNMKMKSQSLSNFCMELQAPAHHNNSQIPLLQLIYLFFSHSITSPEMQDKVISYDKKYYLSCNKNAALPDVSTCCTTLFECLQHIHFTLSV